MRPVGIAQAGGRVAYRLDCADMILVATEDTNGKLLTREVPMCEMEGIRRIRLITEINIQTLICGAVSGFTCRMFQHHGIQVIGWVIGDTRLVLEQYRKGKLQEGTIFYPTSQRGPGHHRARRQKGAQMFSQNGCTKKGKRHGRR